MTATRLTPENQTASSSAEQLDVQTGFGIDHTTFARVERETIDLWTLDGAKRTEVVCVTDVNGSLMFDNESDFKEFLKLDVGTTEYRNFQGCKWMISLIEQRLPAGDLSRAMAVALNTVIQKQLAYIRKQRLSTDDMEHEEDLFRSQRDLGFALASIAKAMDIHSEPGVLVVDDPIGTHAWYRRGQKGRNGGYVAEYAVCTDEFNPDIVDHQDALAELDNPDEGGEKEWPDEFHYPGKLEIRIDPERRIEFVYTPEILSAKQRHMSHSRVERDGDTKDYHNESLSIRLDLDETAPAGIALDVGRGAYTGERNGKIMTRTGDLLGTVLTHASETGSHEYSGITDDMAKQFRAYAERFAVHLDLQHKNNRVAQQKTKLARGALRGA